MFLFLFLFVVPEKGFVKAFTPFIKIFWGTSKSVDLMYHKDPFGFLPDSYKVLI